MPLTVQPGRRLRADRLDRRWPAAGARSINARLPYKTLAELIAAAKANPKKLSFGTSGPASSPAHGAGAAQRGGQDQHRRACPIAARARRRARSPAARSRACSRSSRRPSRWSMTARCARSRSRRRQRIAGWPDVPTFAELGYKIDFRGFVGLAAPAKTPKPIIEYLNKQLNEVVQSDAFKSRMAALGMTRAGGRQHAGEVRRVSPRGDRAAGRDRQAGEDAPQSREAGGVGQARPPTR